MSTTKELLKETFIANATEMTELISGLAKSLLKNNGDTEEESQLIGIYHAVNNLESVISGIELEDVREIKISDANDEEVEMN